MSENLYNQIKSYVLARNRLDPKIVKDMESYLGKQSFNVVVKNNQLHVKPQYVAFRTKDLKKIPCYVQFNFDSSADFDSIRGDIVKLINVIPKKPTLREEIEGIKKDISLVLERILKVVPLQNVTFHKLDGTLCKENSLEAYIASLILEEYLNSFVWIFYISDFMQLESYYERLYKKGQLEHLKASNSDKEDLPRYLHVTSKKEGAHFFGIDPDAMDYSLSAHKDVYTDVTAKAKEMMRYYEYPEKEGTFKFWISHLTLRSGYSTWQRSMELKKYFDDYY
jgi:hypothetical protein